MRQEWGQSGGAWPSRRPWGKLLALLVGLVALAASAAWQYERRFTYLQQSYLGPYLVSGLSPMKSNVYRLVYRGARLAENEDLVDEAVLSRKVKLVRDAKGQWYVNAKLHAWLKESIYAGRGPWVLLGAGWPAAAPVFVVALVLGVMRDRQRARVLREGRRLRGPELVTTRVFNARSGSDGVGFINLERPLWDRIFAPNESLMVCIPRQREAMHMLLVGDTGTGKSALIRQLLVQLEAGRHAAIVYDPALEYAERFYSAERGDVILNPLDERMPYWSPGAEVGHEAEALTLAASLIPDEPRDNPFFVEGARKVFAHLLSLRPTPHELVAWLSDEDEIDRRLKGTPLAAMVYKGAGQQRGGMLASLSMVADSLKLLPRREEAQGAWSAAEWSKGRRGWIFLTSAPDYRKQLRPLTSLWLDLLVLRLMNGREGQAQAAGMPARTWFVLDELASLQKLPQLATALTENRKSGNPVVLGFQGRSQIEARYGREAEAMFSQPATKVFLKTSEAHSARWISETIGNVEVERLRESRSADERPRVRRSQGYQLQSHVEPLVMDSQIMGLEPLHGYLKSGNLVVRLRFPFVERPVRAAGFIPRGTKGAAPPAAGPAVNPAAAPSEAAPLYWD
jgi:hypothetical protein